MINRTQQIALGELQADFARALFNFDILLEIMDPAELDRHVAQIRDRDLTVTDLWPTETDQALIADAAQDLRELPGPGRGHRLRRDSEAAPQDSAEAEGLAARVRRQVEKQPQMNADGRRLPQRRRARRR